ncbi:hypothetical protein F5884DRAFT_396765 [Xylogone sp. PMI_703]|nr:hypothetical protein F5884DRAFT_396765 [Xylogone sp. PMI_703]
MADDSPSASMTTISDHSHQSPPAAVIASTSISSNIASIGTTTSAGNSANGNSAAASSTTAAPATTTTVASSLGKRPRAKAAYPRKRAVQACRTCRLRRTKCDNERPACSSCVGLGIECTYQTGDPSTFDPASLAILARLDTLEELLRSTKQEHQNRHPESPLQQTSPKSSIAAAAAAAASSQSPLSTLRDLRYPSLERTAESVPCYINLEAVLAWPVFEDQNFEGQLDLKQLLQSPDHPSSAPNTSVAADFENYAATQLLQQYLDNVHIFNPVLEETKVREYMRNACFNGLNWDSQSCLLLLICAIGSIMAPFERSSPAAGPNFRRSQEFLQADAFFFAAQKRMGLLLCRTGLTEAQCFFLAGVYLMCTLRPIEAWKMFVQALACCQAFSDHGPARDQAHEEERQLQQRIYWTCFKSELELRLELNVHEKSVWDLTYPAFFPSPPKGLKSQGEAVWFFYLAEIALRRLGNRILNYIYQHDSSNLSDSIDEATVNFEEQAAGWLSSLPPALKLDSPDTNQDHAALKFILNGHLLDCYEMMYWPFVVDAIHGKLRSATAESFARKGFVVCVQRIMKNESGFYHRHHGTWLMLRSCTRSALVLLAAARAPGLRGLLPADWEIAVYKVTVMLNYWKEESRDVMDRLHIIEKLQAGLRQGGN